MLVGSGVKVSTDSDIEHIPSEINSGQDAAGVEIRDIRCFDGADKSPAT
jgi:hypothetical protein